MPRHIVCLTFDFDTQSGFIARGMTSPTMLSRGEFGLIGAQETLSEERVMELIFSAGFSTAEKTSELSGRGVGLDVVRKNVADVNGSLKVESQPGRGTRFIIRLPLTLAIVDGMRVALGEETYILPLLQNSAYNLLRRWAGDGSTQFNLATVPGDEAFRPLDKGGCPLVKTN